MTGPLVVLITTFLASSVEAVEMVTIVLGVGATRGWRSTLIGAAAGFGVLAVIVVVAGLALSQAPIGPLRLIVGALQLVVGILLTTFGPFWSLAGLGIDWPGHDAAILGLLVLYMATAGTYITIGRRRALGFSPGA